MSMFDKVVVPWTDEVLQTHAFDCVGATYRITEDGKFMKDVLVPSDDYTTRAIIREAWLECDEDMKVRPGDLVEDCIETDINRTITLTSHGDTFLDVVIQEGEVEDLESFKVSGESRAEA